VVWPGGLISDRAIGGLFPTGSGRELVVFSWSESRFFYFTTAADGSAVVFVGTIDF
jgi:hypothetical protein